MSYRFRTHKRHATRDMEKSDSTYTEGSSEFTYTPNISTTELPHKKYFHIDDSLEITTSIPPKNSSPQMVEEKRRNDNNTVAKFLNLGYYIITPIVIGIVFGLLLDKALNSTIYVKIFLFVGIAGTFYNLIKLVQETH